MSNRNAKDARTATLAEQINRGQNLTRKLVANYTTAIRAKGGTTAKPSASANQSKNKSC
jgi:hypothetical protein